MTRHPALPHDRKHRATGASLRWLAPALLLALATAPAARAQVSVLTHHDDISRTGWNSAETALNYTTVAGHGTQPFGLLRTIPLDEQVDAQPLVLHDQVVTGDPNPGTHDVVYVATENNTVYAIDPTRGTILASRNLGTPVSLPLGCTSNSAVVGITGTPVIDTTLNTPSMFVIAYVQGAKAPAYYIHRLSLTNLSDVLPPVQITASATLTSGTKTTFNAAAERQRTALLDYATDYGVGVFAGFSSFCDSPDNGLTRGWLLGWQNWSLDPYPINNQPGVVLQDVTDKQASSPNKFFLSSIWMSGYGPAGNSGQIWFSTGNTDPSGTKFNAVTNIANSVVRFSPDTNAITSYFTPFNEPTLDEEDVDVSAGSVLMVPTSVPPLPPGLVVATAKSGYMYLLNGASLGGYNKTKDKVVQEVGIGPCWCGPSYYDDSAPNLTGSGPKIVSSGGSTVVEWSITSSGLVAGPTATISTGQDGGFQTSVSSNGASQPIIWAVSRPTDSNPADMTLYAFQAQAGAGATTLPTLFQGTAGTWPNSNADADTIPVVANGYVYVASYKQLSVFGLGTPAPQALLTPQFTPSPLVLATAPNEVSGTLQSVSGTTLTLTTRTGATVQVQASADVQANAIALLLPGQPILVRGTLSGGVLQAVVINRLKPSAALWPVDNL